ncbi:MAG: ferritin-like domain-containing protein [Christensenellales bacterium]
MDTRQYSLSLPYPEITGYLSPKEVRCLVDDYGGRKSETTAIMQYIYQHYVLDADYPQIGDALLGIAVTEMHHHELLGEAITLAGGDPIIAGSTCFWSGSNVNYIKNPVAALRANIEAERQAIAKYRRTISCVSNASLKDLISRIIMDEELHVSIFEDLLQTLADGQSAY